MSKIKGKFLLVNYEKSLCKHVQNLKQKDTFFCEYSEKIFKLSLTSRRMNQNMKEW
jgi:hypothetical protein